MKKNKLLLIVMVFLTGIAVYFVLANREGSIQEALRDFAVKDTGSVVKIFLADKNGQQALLEKQPGGEWMLNGTMIARPDAVKTLLETLHNIEVRSPIGKNAYNTVIKTIAASGIKVEVYSKEGLVKTLYVGGPTQDLMGTFMYLENSTVPFITHLPGFDGYLTPRFIVKADDWKVKSIFRIPDGRLNKLTVIDRQETEKSFTIEKMQGGDYALYDGKGNAVENASQDKIINYLESYRMLNYEMLEQSLSPAQADSIKATTPFRTIIVENGNGKSTHVDFWRRPITESTKTKATEDGVPFPYDIDRMTARVNQEPELVVVQYFSFEKLFRNTRDFQLPPGQK